MVFHQKMGISKMGKQYLSTVSNQQAVCKPFKYRFLKAYFYKQPMGRGSSVEVPVIKKHKWLKLPLDANNSEAELTEAKLMNFICRN